MQFARSTLCVLKVRCEEDDSPSPTRAEADTRDGSRSCDWNQATEECFRNQQAPLCRYEQIFRACRKDLPIERLHWLADRDDEALATKNSIDDHDHCKNLAKEFDLSEDLRGGYCCLEWMKY